MEFNSVHISSNENSKISCGEQINKLVTQIYPIFYQITNNHDIAERIATKYILQQNSFIKMKKKHSLPFEKQLQLIENTYQKKIDIMRSYLIVLSRLNYILNRKIPSYQLPKLKVTYQDILNLNPPDLYLQQLIQPVARPCHELQN